MCIFAAVSSNFQYLNEQKGYCPQQVVFGNGLQV